MKISEEIDSWTRGAKCGIGKYNGYALYPLRFFVNITSHIEWYLSRGVDIKVVLSMRDRSISSRGKLKGHCHLADVARREDEVALDLMAEAIQKYGSSKDRVNTVSYEGLMGMQQSYLFEVYAQLGIQSTHIPSFYDGNEKYVTNANLGKEELDLEQQQQQQQIILDSRPPKPQKYRPPPTRASLLPKS